MKELAITSKTIKITAEATLEEFKDVKEFITHLNGGYFSYVNDYIIAYVLLKDYGYDAIKITSVKIDSEAQKVFIEFESKFESKI